VGQPRPGLVISGGGARLVFQIGVLLGAEIAPDQFGAMYALSSGGPVLAYFAAGQIHHAKRLWVDTAGTDGFIDWRRLFVLAHPGDTRILIDQGCASLHTHAIPRSRVFIGTLRVRDGHTIYHDLGSKSRSGIEQILRATCALPLLTEPEIIDGDEHVDGGVEYTFPVYEALVSGCHKILAIGNQPPTYRMKPFGRLQSLALFPHSQPARHAIRRRARRYTEACAFLAERQTSGTRSLYLQPDVTLPAERLTTDRQRIRQTFELGLELGRRRKQDIHCFLDEEN